VWQKKKFSHYLDVKRNMSRNNRCRIFTFLTRPFETSRRQRKKRSINWSVDQRLISIPFGLRCRKGMHLELLILFSLYLVQLYTTSNWWRFTSNLPFVRQMTSAGIVVWDAANSCWRRNQLLQSTHNLNGQLKHTDLVIFPRSFGNNTKWPLVYKKN
jgi:hypothetical protein